MRQLQKHLKTSCEKYEDFLIMGDFNADSSDPSVTSSCTLFKHYEGTEMLKEPRKSQMHCVRKRSL